MSKHVKNNYRKVRAALMHQGHTIASWSRSRGYRPTTVYSIASGHRKGSYRADIVRELERLIHA